jgi:hypothetical protein
MMVKLTTTRLRQGVKMVFWGLDRKLLIENLSQESLTQWQSIRIVMNSTANFNTNKSLRLNKIVTLQKLMFMFLT